MRTYKLLFSILCMTIENRSTSNLTSNEDGCSPEKRFKKGDGEITDCGVCNSEAQIKDDDTTTEKGCCCRTDREIIKQRDSFNNGVNRKDSMIRKSKDLRFTDQNDNVNHTKSLESNLKSNFKANNSYIGVSNNSLVRDANSLESSNNSLESSNNSLESSSNNSLESSNKFYISNDLQIQNDLFGSNNNDLRNNSNLEGNNIKDNISLENNDEIINNDLLNNEIINNDLVNNNLVNNNLVNIKDNECLKKLHSQQSSSSKAREMISTFLNHTNAPLTNIVQQDTYPEIEGRCIENILGYLKIPLGLTKDPLLVNGKKFFIPLCTTEGALVASLCRGIKLINRSGGISGMVENLGITRSFAVEFPSFRDAVYFYKWMKEERNVSALKREGDSTSRYLRVKSIETKHIVGTLVYIKVYAYTGDAMGMNMITKACNKMAVSVVSRFKGSKLVCISANICTDKKWSNENYCNGRGRRVFLYAEIRDKDCREVLRVSVSEIYKVYYSKICVGSGLVLGSMNCQAANYISSIFIALGQDVGQVIESSNCMLSISVEEDVMKVSLWMPSLVVGMVGGGTHLKPQNDFLRQFYLEDSEMFVTERELDMAVAPNYLALAVASSVLCGELSCLAALADNTLVEAHMKLNRKEESLCKREHENGN